MEGSYRDATSRFPSWLSALVIVLTFLLVPEQVLSSFNEELWKLQLKLRREVLQVLRSVTDTPLVRHVRDAGLWLLRKFSRGRWSSPCLPPLALGARAGGQGEVLILWSSHHQPNPFHEETYLYAWKAVGQPNWKEEPVTENLCRELRGAPGRWGTILDVPPEYAVTRIRVCATNQFGRSEWSREEVEVTQTSPPGMKIRIVSSESLGQCCAQCTKPVPKTGCALYACLVRRSIFSPGCRHGPFCGSCQQRLARKVLPCCVCRGLIDSWCEKEDEEDACTQGLLKQLDVEKQEPQEIECFSFKWISWAQIAMASGAERFELLLVNEHKVAAEVFAALRNLGCESVADFVGLYTESDYEEGLKEVLQRTAKQDLSTTSAGSQDENLEAPLPPEVRQRQEDAFFAKYGLRFPPDLLPEASLFARHFREFRRHHKELDDLARVKSAAEASSAPATEVKQLGDFRVVLKAESPAVSFKDLISLLRAHEILLNSLAMAGTAERDSKILAGTKVCEFSMSDNLAYRTFAADRLRRYPGSVAQAAQSGP
eukprot:s445_g22.t1